MQTSRQHSSNCTLMFDFMVTKQKQTFNNFNYTFLLYQLATKDISKPYSRLFYKLRIPSIISALTTFVYLLH